MVRRGDQGEAIIRSNHLPDSINQLDLLFLRTAIDSPERGCARKEAKVLVRCCARRAAAAREEARDPTPLPTRFRSAKLRRSRLTRYPRATLVYHAFAWRNLSRSVGDRFARGGRFPAKSENAWMCLMALADHSAETGKTRQDEQERAAAPGTKRRDVSSTRTNDFSLTSTVAGTELAFLFPGRGCE